MKRFDSFIFQERCINAGTLTVNFEKVPVDYKLKHNDLLANIVHRYRVSEKRGPCLRAIEGTRIGLKTKLGRVLENSGNFLSNEHKNIFVLSKND